MCSYQSTHVGKNSDLKLKFLCKGESLVRGYQSTHMGKNSDLKLKFLCKGGEPGARLPKYPCGQK